MGLTDQTWKDFERLVERLQRGFHQNATITPNDKIIGQNTGRSRQIDISVRYRLGPTDVLIIVDCKKWRRRIDAPAMDTFIGLKQDVKAHVGVLVCEQGFSKAAVRLAERNNIQLFTIADTQKPRWQIHAKVRVFVEEWMLSPLLMRYVDEHGTKMDFPDDRAFTLTAPDGTNETAAGVVKKLWLQHNKREAGDYFFETGAGRTIECREKFVFGFRAEVQCYSRTATLALLGLRNVADGLTYTDAMKIETTTEREVKYEKPGVLPFSGETFGVLIQSTEVKAVERANPQVDLRTNRIEFTLNALKEPLCINLGSAAPV